MEEALESAEPEQLRMFEQVPTAYRDPASCTEAARMLGELEKEKKRLEERLKRIAEERGMVINAVTVQMVREYPFACRKCRNSAPLHRWALSRLRYHVPPRGCYEGDYWVTEKVGSGKLCCPACGYWNSLFASISRPHEHAVLFLTRLQYRLSEVFDAPVTEHEDC
ncbi:MAG: hypothetical protein IT405_01735 [Candidatus Yanofskybacteria bacterium]|nr:hypothetical protein [Candidatus Yanofskybacteria bacterium]